LTVGGSHLRCPYVEVLVALFRDEGSDANVRRIVTLSLDKIVSGITLDL
jgi:hypothetical protein